MFSRREAIKTGLAALLFRRIPQDVPKVAWKEWKHYTAQYRTIQDRELIAKIRAAREKHRMNLVNAMEEAIFA